MKNMNVHDAAAIIANPRQLSEDELAAIHGGFLGDAWKFLKSVGEEVVDFAEDAAEWVEEAASDAWEFVTSDTAKDIYETAGVIIGVVTAGEKVHDWVTPDTPLHGEGAQVR